MYVRIHTGHYAYRIFDAIRRNDTKLIMHIISIVGTPNIFDMVGTTILHYAVLIEQEEVVSFLVDIGARVNTVTKDQGRSPLYSAYMLCNKHIIDMLITAGARRIKDVYGWYPQ